MKIYLIITSDNDLYYVLALNHEEAMRIFKEKVNKEVCYTKIYLDEVIKGD